ncbi:hypothetical protein F2P56_008352, partial [Juglans regia]
MEEPLLSEQRSDAGEKESGKWSSYQYVGRTGSGIPTASLAGTEVSVEEIRSAAAFSDHYPPSLHSALVGSPEPDPDPNGKRIFFPTDFFFFSMVISGSELINNGFHLSRIKDL